jgi:hypothetical protein
VQAGRSFWVDMESKLRDEQDGFSLDRCEDVLLQTEGFLNEQRYKEATLWRAGWRTVDNLEGLWLDWWAGAAVGVSLVVPPKDACAAMRLVRRTGNFERYSPGAHISSLERLLHGENIALRAFSTGWRAGCATLVSGGEKALEASGPDIATAGLRAIVAKHFGHTVPCQPLLDLATREYSHDQVLRTVVGASKSLVHSPLVSRLGCHSGRPGVSPDVREHYRHSR